MNFYLHEKTIKKVKMQKLLKKDKKLRDRVKQSENKCYIFKCILKNLNFFVLIR